MRSSSVSPASWRTGRACSVPENPVTRAGHATAAGVLAERWQVSTGTARRYCTVGEATGTRLSLTGEVLPPRFPALASATGAPVEDASPNDADGSVAGWVSVEQAAVIVRELSKVADRCPLEDLHDGEQILVEHAPSLTVPELRTLAGHVRDRLDQDGIEPREARQRRRRSLTITTTADGMTRIDWLLDPESAGYVVSAVDAVVTADLRQVRFRDNQRASAAEEDEDLETRSVAQLRSDAAVDVFRHVAGCDRTAVDGLPPVTVIVRIGLDELRTGVGTGEIDGVDRPGQRRNRTADGRRRRHHPRRPRRGQRSPRSRPVPPPLQHRATAGVSGKGRRVRLAGVSAPAVLHRSAPHPLVERPRRRHGPGQRDPVVQQPPPPRPRRRLADQRARAGAVFRPARTCRPIPTTPARRPRPIPGRRMNPSP